MNVKRRKVECNLPEVNVSNNRIASFNWEILPDTVCLKVFSYVNFCDLVLKVSHVCTKFRRLVFDRYLWRDLCLLNSKFDLGDLSENEESQVLIRHLFHVSKFVRKVDFRYCGPISGTVLSTLSNECLQHLQSLSLEGCVHIKDQGISRIAKVCTALRDVNLLFTSVTAHSLIELFQNNRNIESLVCHSSCLTLKALTVLTSFCPGVRVLHADDTEMAPSQSPENANEVANVLTNDMLYQITKLSQLRVLILKYESVVIHDTYFNLLGKSCPLLECIELSYIGVSSILTDTSLVNTCYFLSNLQYLHLYEFVEVTNATLETLASCCSSLKSVSLENGYFDDQGIISLVQRCQDLESLAIGVSDNSLKDLTDKSVYAIAKNCGRRLCHLHMIGWDLTDIGLLTIATALTQLKHLSVESCMLLTHEGLARAMNHMKGLLSLDLSFTDIFFNNLNTKTLNFPATLRKLRLCGLGLAESEISCLRHTLPCCDVREY